jgi:hypothetical protein
MEALYSDLNFPRCADEWDYDPRTFSGARFRAEIVRKELARLPGPNVVVIGHRGFIAFLVEMGKGFENCGTYSLSVVSNCQIIYLYS